MEPEAQRILEMVRDGIITPDEAARLLDALDTPNEQAAQRRPRTLRVAVTDLKTGRARVNINIPLELVEIASKMGITLGVKHAPELADINFDEILSAIQSGAEGKIVDIEDDDDRQHVTVAVE